jgi:tetratricopeptide (TPR) repeat protein
MAIPNGFPAALLAAGTLFLPVALGPQSRPSSSPPPSSTSPGSNPGGTRGGTPSPNNQPTPNASPSSKGPVFISGVVALDDGSVLPPNVALVSVCGIATRIEGYANSKGYFSLDLSSRNDGVLQDASTSGFGTVGAPPGNFGDTSSINNRPSLLGCELKAQVAGYQSQRVDLGMRRALDNPDVGTILLHRIAATEGKTVSATTLAAPKGARKSLQKGLDLEKKRKIAEAQASLQEAVDAYPRFAEGWFELGRLQAVQGQFDAARESFDHAIQSDSGYVPPYIEISKLELRAQNWQELADITDKAVRLDPFGFPQEFFFNAVANYNLHRVDAAEQSARRAERLDTRHQIPQVSHLLGTILADRHDFAAAAAEMRDYLKFAPQATDAAAVRSQLDELEKAAAGAAAPQ